MTTYFHLVRPPVKPITTVVANPQNSGVYSGGVNRVARWVDYHMAERQKYFVYCFLMSETEPTRAAKWNCGFRVGIAQITQLTANFDDEFKVYHPDPFGIAGRSTLRVNYCDHLPSCGALRPL